MLKFLQIGGLSFIVYATLSVILSVFDIQHSSVILFATSFIVSCMMIEQGDQMRLEEFEREVSKRHENKRI